MTQTQNSIQRYKLSMHNVCPCQHVVFYALNKHQAPVCSQSAKIESALQSKTNANPTAAPIFTLLWAVLNCLNC